MTLANRTVTFPDPRNRLDWVQGDSVNLFIFLLVSVCVRARARARVCVCVCVCVWREVTLNCLLGLSPPRQ